jgi:WD40 repeat protein
MKTGLIGGCLAGMLLLIGCSTRPPAPWPTRASNPTITTFVLTLTPALTQTPTPDTPTPYLTRTPRPTHTNRPTHTPGPTSTPRPTSTPIPTRTLTFTPGPSATPLPTTTPNLTPTIPPVVENTLLPQPAAPITLDNISQVAELARWGKGSVTDVRYSPFGRFLLVETTTGKYLYDSATLEPVELTEERWQLNFTEKTKRELKWLDGTIQVWQDGYFVSNLEGVLFTHPNVFSPDGDLVAALINLPTIGIWRVNDGKLLHSLFPVGVQGDGTLCYTQIAQIVFSHDGQYLASTCTEGQVYLWRVADGSLINTLHEDPNRDMSPGSLCFSADDSLLAAGLMFGTTRVWHVPDGELVQTFTNEGAVYWMNAGGLAFSPDGENLVTGFQNGEVLIWRVSDGELLSRLHGLTPSGNGLDFSSDGKLLAASAWKGALVWNVADGRLQNELVWQPGALKLASAARKVLASWDGLPAEVERLVVSPHGKYLAWYMSDAMDTIQVWDLTSGSQSLMDQERAIFPLGVAFSQQDELLAFGQDGTRITFWKVGDEAHAPVETFPTKYLSAFGKFSPDGQFWAWGGDYDNPLKVNRASDGHRFKTTVMNCVNNFVFSPDSVTILIHQCGSIDLWRVNDWSYIQSLGDPDYFYSPVYSPDGQILATGDVVGNIYLWRASDWTFLRTLEGHTRGVASLAFSPDGRLLASSSRDGTVRLWGVR